MPKLPSIKTFIGPQSEPRERRRRRPRPPSNSSIVSPLATPPTTESFAEAMRPRPVRDHPSTPYVEFAAWLCCLSSLTVIFLDLRGAFSGNAFSSWTYGMAAFALGFAATHILAIFSQIISDSRSSKGILALLTFWIGLIAIFVLDWIIVRFFS